MNTLKTEPLLAVPLHRLVRSFRAGDHVKHAPTGEEWELACDEERGEVMPAGWPMGIAKAEHCTLIEAATDEKRIEVLTQWAKEGRGYEAERDWRTLTASNIVEGREQRIWKMPPSADRWKERSRTLPGVAGAMANQWALATRPNAKSEPRHE